MDRTVFLLINSLLYGLMPAWLLAGFGDYCCHRFQHIEHATGLKESILHLAMLAELGVGLICALLLEINAAVFVVLLVSCVSHELTLWWDLAYAAARRPIPVPEQWVHGLQQAIPWAGLVALGLLHPAQFQALVGLGDTPADWSLRVKPDPLPATYLASLAGAALLLVLLPFIEEYRRCRRSSVAEAGRSG